MSDSVEMPLPNETDNLLNIRDVDAPVVPVAPPADLNEQQQAAEAPNHGMMDMMDDDMAPTPVNTHAAAAPVDFGGMGLEEDETQQQPVQATTTLSPSMLSQEQQPEQQETFQVQQDQSMPMPEPIQAKEHADAEPTASYEQQPQVEISTEQQQAPPKPNDDVTIPAPDQNNVTMEEPTVVDGTPPEAPPQASLLTQEEKPDATNNNNNNIKSDPQGENNGTTDENNLNGMTAGGGEDDAGVGGLSVNTSFDMAEDSKAGEEDEGEQPNNNDEDDYSKKRPADDSITGGEGDTKRFKKRDSTGGGSSVASNFSATATVSDAGGGIPSEISSKKKPGRKPGSLNKKKSTSSYGGGMPSWNDMFFALMAFKAKLGTFNVPAQTKLGKWVTKQRQEYSKLQRKKISYHQCSELSEERIQVLNSLNFIWDTMLHENGRRWNQRFDELKKWKDEHGHTNVPQSTSLGQWVKIQRENKREADLKAAGKLPNRTKPKPCLAQDRIDQLNQIGFQWRVAAPVTGWDNRYRQLLDYAKQHNGDVNVPQYYPADKAFGRWVMKQRSEYSLRLRGLKSQLTAERVDKLNAIGFSWVAPNFKRKVGVGIAPGSPAANIAATMQESPAPSTTNNAVPKLPPMDKNLLGDANTEVHNPTATAPQPVPAAATADPPGEPPQAPAMRPPQQHLESHPPPPPHMHHQQQQPPHTVQQQQQQQPPHTHMTQQPPQIQQQHSQAGQAQQHQQQQQPPLQMPHHLHHPGAHPGALHAGDAGVQALHYDPNQHQHPQQVEHHQHLHHMNQHHVADQQQQHTIHPHHQQQHDDIRDEDVVNMEFL